MSVCVRDRERESGGERQGGGWFCDSMMYVCEYEYERGEQREREGMRMRETDKSTCEQI